MKVSIVIPCYNERGTIERILREVERAPVADKEIIVVDDYSVDGTREVLRERVDGVMAKVVYHDRNQGKGAALRTGFARATNSGIEGKSRLGCFRGEIPFW